MHRLRFFFVVLLFAGSAGAVPVPDPIDTKEAKRPTLSFEPLDIAGARAKLCALADKKEEALYKTITDKLQCGKTIALDAPAYASECDAAAAINGDDATAQAVAKSDGGRALLRLCGFWTSPMPQLRDICKDASAKCKAPADASKAQRWRGRRDHDLKLEEPAVTVCEFVNSRSGVDLKDADAKSALVTLTERCSTSAPSGATAGVDPLSMIAMTALQGLGDFLKDRAKEEMLDFAVERFGREICKVRANAFFDGAAIFPNACKLIFPTGVDGKADADAIVSGGFQNAILSDLKNLPRYLFKVANPMSSDPALSVMMQVLAKDSMALMNGGGGDLLDLLKGYREHVDVELAKLDKQPPVECRLEPNTKPTASCVVLLWLTLVSTAKDVFEQPGAGQPKVVARSIEEWAREATLEYCRAYGKGRPTDGSCVFGLGAETSAMLAAWAASFKTFYDRMVDIQAAIDAQKKAGKFSWQILLEELPEVTSAVEDFLDGAIDGSEIWFDRWATNSTAPKDAGAVRDKAKEILEETKAICGVMSAVVNKDVAKSIRLFLALPFIAKDIDPAAKKALLFAVAIAEAKTRDDAKKAIEDIAAPRGTWKAKYIKSAIMLNGYVGVMGVVPYWTATNLKDQTNWRGFEKAYVMPLSAPVGLDFSWTLGAWFHVGTFVSVLDPLALKVTTPAGGNVQVDFDPVLVPGAALRIGIAKSPFTAMVGMNVRPLVKSPDRDCGAMKDALCWQAPMSVFFGAGVDIPILQLR